MHRTTPVAVAASSLPWQSAWGQDVYPCFPNCCAAAPPLLAPSAVLLLGVTCRNKGLSTAVIAPCCRFWRNSAAHRQLPQCVLNLGLHVGSWQWQTDFLVNLEDGCSVETWSDRWSDC